MVYEVYQTRRHYFPRRVTPELRVQSPRITFNKACTEWLRRHEITHVIYLFDREDRKIAIGKLKPGDNGYSIRFGTSQATVCGAAFLKFANVKDGLYPCYLDDSEIVIEIHLDEAAPERGKDGKS